MPAGGQYTNLELKSYQISGANGSSDSNTATVWSGNSVVSVGFTIDSPDFISAKDFIGNFAAIPTCQTGYVSSITKNDSEGGTTYTYTGTVSLNMTDNTTSRSDNFAGVKAADRELLAKLRKNLDQEASGKAASADGAASSDSNATSN